MCEILAEKFFFKWKQLHEKICLNKYQLIAKSKFLMFEVCFETGDHVTNSK